MSDLNKSSENLGIERIYNLIKEKLNNTKDNELIIDQNIYNKDNSQLYKEEIKNAIKYIPFNEKTNWNYSTFSTNINKYNIDYPEILSSSWTPTKIDFDNGIDITNKIFECEETIDYRLVNNFIKANVLLKGDGMFLIFLHLNHKFNDKTVVILFSKREYSQRVTMSLGSFVKLDYFNSQIEEGNNFFIFQKQQLIKSYKKEKHSKEIDIYEKDDSCLIKISIIDEGYNEIKIISKLNNGVEDNILIGKQYESVVNTNNFETNSIKDNDDENNYRVMIAGNGLFCKVNNFYCETKIKKNIGNNKIESGETCQCCQII